MEERIFTVESNRELCPGVMKMTLSGDTGAIVRPGQFVNLKINGLFLRRPISVCDLEPGRLTLTYKTVGKGTLEMSRMAAGTEINILTGLGNGFDTSLSGDSPLLIGGGIGAAPMYYLAKKLCAEGKKVSVILGFNKKDEIYFEKEFGLLGCSVTVTTADGSYGVPGFVTAAMDKGYSYFYACGPEPMLKAVHKASVTSGQLSFERRMGCGFGACMGCSCKTLTGSKRICREGPVMVKEEIMW